jgi:hypothetical protein
LLAGATCLAFAASFLASPADLSRHIFPFLPRFARAPLQENSHARSPVTGMQTAPFVASAFTVPPEPRGSLPQSSRSPWEWSPLALGCPKQKRRKRRFQNVPQFSSDHRVSGQGPGATQLEPTLVIF